MSDGVRVSGKMVEIIAGLRKFPMGRATMLRSHDLSLVEQTVSGLVDPRQFSHQGRFNTADIRISHVAMNLGHLFGVQHGSPVHVTSGPIRSYQVMVPLRGRLLGRTRDAEILAEPGVALVYSPTDCFDTCWSDDCIALVLSLFADKLMGLAHHVYHGFESQGLKLQPRLRLKEGGGRSFANVLGTICQESVDENSAFRRGLTTKALEEALLLSLLMAQKEGPFRPPPHTGPTRHTHITRSLNYIEAHCADGIGMMDLVNAAGVSIRTLQYSFMEQFGVGPMTYVKHVRLRKVYETLKSAMPGECTVGDVAAAWGFYNGSAFAKAYRKLFAELPSETLCRR